MKRPDRILIEAAILAWLVLAVPECWTTEPTLARLSFWVPPERMAEFGRAYREKVVPILKRHGLAASAKRGRATPDSIFSKLFDLKSPTEVGERWQDIRADPAWARTAKELGEMFGASGRNGQIRHAYRVYIAPAGTGSVAPLGRGKGHWRTYDVTNGLRGPYISTVIQDREGVLWFGTGGSGVAGDGLSRFDGQTFTTLTTEDGLAGNRVWSIIQDRTGSLWCGTDAGVSRYDGETWTSFTTTDGLVSNVVRSIFQDRAGNFWFGTRVGVSRYDGETWTTFTARDVLASNYVVSIIQNRNGDLWFGGLGGVSRYDGETWTTFTPDGLVSNLVSSIGEDLEGNLWFGTFLDGVIRYDGETWDSFGSEDGVASNSVFAINQSKDGSMWFGTVDGVRRFDGTAWVSFTTEDGLASNNVRSITQDNEGNLWFGTYGGGVSCYDDDAVTTFTTEDGLAENYVFPIFQDKSGSIWFGTDISGVTRFDSETVTTFTKDDGLVNNYVRSIFQDREGHLWFGNLEGVTRYDGKTWTTFAREDGMGGGGVYSIVQDRTGMLWFSTYGGVSQYDGQTWTTFTTHDGLVHNRVLSIIQDREGVNWFGTIGGVSRYDGRTWTTYTTDDGLVHNLVRSIIQDRDGVYWFGTNGGVSRFDGESWSSFTTEDGLRHNRVRSILQDDDGVLWIGTQGGGVSRFDGRIFQSLDSSDGLGSNAAASVVQIRSGTIWMSTSGGVTRYRKPRSTPPSISMVAVVADRRYAGMDQVSVDSGTPLTTFHFAGYSFKTSAGGIVYRYRLTGYDKDWRTTRKQQVEYQDLPTGSYIFEVLAVDRDLAYSESPAIVTLTVHLPYERMGWMSGLSLFVLLTAWQTVRVVRRDRRLREEAEGELRTAHDMQMRLMPSEHPTVHGLDIAGDCIPASEVGGDFFQYFDHNGRLSVAMADVTGHAMAAAIPVVLFSGVLESQIRRGEPVRQLFGELNESLCRILDRRTFVCFTLGELDPSTCNLRLSNGGCPYPYHFRAATEEITELQVDAYPLGVRANTEYQVVETQLQPGDRIVFCSDGIPEADNASGQQFGYGRTEATILQACKDNLSAEATIDHLLAEVAAFKGDVPQSDDMTCVVLRVEG